MRTRLVPARWDSLPEAATNGYLVVSPVSRPESRFRAWRSGLSRGKVYVDFDDIRGTWLDRAEFERDYLMETPAPSACWKRSHKT